jgi:hypothetical protein
MEEDFRTPSKGSGRILLLPAQTKPTHSFEMKN